MKRKDILFIGLVLLAALLIWGGFRLFGDRSGELLVITVDGKEYGTYPLSQDREISIGTTNRCRIHNGKVTMIQADCPDHLCMKQKSIDASGGTIVCLPNKVVLEIVTDGSGTSGPVDVIAQ